MSTTPDPFTNPLLGITDAELLARALRKVFYRTDLNLDQVAFWVKEYDARDGRVWATRALIGLYQSQCDLTIADALNA